MEEIIDSPCDKFLSRIGSLPNSSRLFALVLAGVLGATPVSRASLSFPTPLAAPVIDACTFVPDPRVNISFACGDANAPAAFVDLTVSFRANVSDSTSNNMSVAFYFDYYNPNSSGGPPIVNPDSPMRTINLSAGAVGSVVTADTTWTYRRLSNFSAGQYWVNVSVRNGLGEFDPSSGSIIFPVIVHQNSAPFIDGLLSVNSVQQALRYQNPVIPLLYENVTIGDPDADPVTVTWAWGDGTLTINQTGPLPDRMELKVTHRYSATLFSLNETPRTVDILVRVWIDDGLGHNVSYNSTAEFYIDFDAPPNVRVESPTTGSVWKVGESVPMVGNVTDPEGDPITAYWDFDNRTDSTAIGDPTRNRDANGTTARHAYSSPGLYDITLWATDGEKEFCRDTNCTLFYTHWQSETIPVQVRYNLPPFVAMSNVTAQLQQPVLLQAAVYDPDGDNMTVRWVFGDGTPDATNVTGSSPRASPRVFQVSQDHTYTTVGNETLTLYVSDGNATVHDSRLVFVQSFNEPPVLLGIQVSRADGTSAGNNTFRINETVIITVMAYDPENDTLNVSINWGDGTSVNRTVDPKTGPDCSVDNLSRNICSVSFSHKYSNTSSSQFQNYSVLVTITDNQVFMEYDAASGEWNTLDHTKSQTVVVLVTNFQSPGLPFTVVLSADSTNGTVPFIVTFTATPSGGMPPYSFYWDFGDGGASGLQNPSHTYEAAGTYTVVLSVRDGEGRTVTKTIAIKATSPGTTVSGAGIPPWVLYVAVASVAAVAGVGVLLRRRGKIRQLPPP